jgi:MoaA/NifB/PqqE/SkfB family radical SAM enzyme
MKEYIKLKNTEEIPRIPLNGFLDLIYRCNNNCRHCWVRTPSEASEKYSELTVDEIKKLVNDARKMGCRQWHFSGGEPMIRPDFTEIFDYITKKSASYSLNTNGTLINPKIARLLRRKGSKMIALCGATARVHDWITRTPGSFEATMQGFAYLKEAGASFIVQLIPMKDNYHQFKDMIQLAESLSPRCRIGATWLYLTDCRDSQRNQEIIRQRLSPKIAVETDKPDTSDDELIDEKEDSKCRSIKEDEPLLSCISRGCNFHIDPYGLMSFCAFIKDSSLRYDLRKGNFKECWERFILSLSNKVKANREYLENCGSCKLRSNCRWCPAYGYLEHGRFSAKIEYLCAIAKENRKFKEKWKKYHRRYYQIADITIQVDSDLPITDGTFHKKFKHFEVKMPSEDKIYIRHHFALPDLNSRNLGTEIYRKAPWIILKNRNNWIYLEISRSPGDEKLQRVISFNYDHTKVRIYNSNKNSFSRGKHEYVTLSPIDEILLARILIDREGCYVHSSGVKLGEKGLLLVGHSGSGKSTIAKMLRNKAKILSDDRVIIRKHPEGFRIHGTWNYGELQEVSATSALLRGIFFLVKDKNNQIIPNNNKEDLMKRLMDNLIMPLINTGWWDKMLSLIESIVSEVPCYSLHFNKRGKMGDLLEVFERE